METICKSSVHSDELFYFVSRFIVNDSLCPLPRAGEPSNIVSSAPALSSDSSDLYNSDDARRFLREWRVTQNRYSEVTRENGQLEICLGVSQAALHAAKEEANVIRARLAESDATVAGKMNSMEAFHSNFHYLHLDSILAFVIISPDSIVGISPTGGECSRRRHQCPGFPY